MVPNRVSYKSLSIEDFNPEEMIRNATSHSQSINSPKEITQECLSDIVGSISANQFLRFKEILEKTQCDPNIVYGQCRKPLLSYACLEGI